MKRPRGHAPAPLRHGKSDAEIVRAVTLVAKQHGTPARDPGNRWVYTGTVAIALELSRERTRKYLRALAVAGVLETDPPMDVRYLGAAERRYRVRK